MNRPDVGLSVVGDGRAVAQAAGSRRRCEGEDTAARTGCEEMQKYLITWPSWLFARGDVAAGGAGDESPLEFSDNSLKVEAKHRFRFFRGGRGGGRGRGAPHGRPAKVYLNAALVNPSANGKPVIIWRNPTVGFRARLRSRATAGPGSLQCRRRARQRCRAAAGGTAGQAGVRRSRRCRCRARHRCEPW